MPKPFLSFEAQIRHLEQNKNLIITNHEYAKQMLRQIGYFGLIGGFVCARHCIQISACQK